MIPISAAISIGGDTQAEVTSSRVGSAEFWKKIFREQFSREKIFENMASEVTKYLSRTLGWLSLELVLYRGQNLLNRKRKKRDETEEDFSRNCERSERGLI